MNVKLEWEKEEVLCVFCGGGGLGESGYFQDREREKITRINLKRVFIKYVDPSGRAV